MSLDFSWLVAEPARRVAGSGPRVNAAHLRFFLEPWATVLSGQVVEFDRLPALPR
jgi:hypothetical protein